MAWTLPARALRELPPLQDDEVYLHDLIECRINATGEPLGTVSTVLELPQGIMLDVERARGASVMIPYRPEIIVRTDIDARTIVINDTIGFGRHLGFYGVIRWR